MTGCTRCDRHGPDLPGSWVAWLDLHRAAHAYWRTLTAPLHRLTRKALR